MTRKDFVLIAEVLRQERDNGSRGQWESVVLNMAHALEQTSGFDLNGNRRFKRDRFLQAAGMEVR